MHSRFTSKLFTLLCIFLSTLLLILYPSQAASDESANDFINNLFNSSGGGSERWQSLVLGVDVFNSSGGGSERWQSLVLGVDVCICVRFGLVWM
jgi:hypothetical protein